MDTGVRTACPRRKPRAPASTLRIPGPVRLSIETGGSQPLSTHAWALRSRGARPCGRPLAAGLYGGCTYGQRPSPGVRGTVRRTCSFARACSAHSYAQVSAPSTSSPDGPSDTGGDVGPRRSAVSKKTARPRMREWEAAARVAGEAPGSLTQLMRAVPAWPGDTASPFRPSALRRRSRGRTAADRVPATRIHMPLWW